MYWLKSEHHKSIFSFKVFVRDQRLCQLEHFDLHYNLSLMLPEILQAEFYLHEIEHFCLWFAVN